MTPVEAALALGIREPSIYAVPPSRLRRHQHEGGFFYRAFEVEAYLLSLRLKRLWTVNRRDGTYQMLSETLLIVPRTSLARTNLLTLCSLSPWPSASFGLPLQP